jgi:amidase
MSCQEWKADRWKRTWPRMVSMAEMHNLTALEQGAAMRRGEFSSAELVEHYLARIAAHGEALGAFVTVTAGSARAEAAGVADGAGALRGVPIAIKDQTLTAGVRTTFGSAAFADFLPPVDADVVVLMRDAGLISLGKTTTSEFGLSLYSETRVAPPARNPWATAFTAGGSSGGAAAAVAAGLVPFAQGSDGGGSLRIPASICGVVGYKPSRGLVSGGPMGHGGFGLPTPGPIARTVADVAALLDVLGAPVQGEPYSSLARPPAGFRDAARRPEHYLPKDRPLRVGRYRASMIADVVPTAAVVAAWEDATVCLAALGCEIIDVDPPFGHDAEAAFQTLWRVLSLAPVPPGRESLLLPLTRWLREGGRAITAEQLTAAMADLQVRVRRHARGSASYDVLLSPVLARAQAPVGWFAAAGDPAEDFARQARFSPYCAAYNLTGQPAVSLPLGQDADGAPIGVMLAAPVGADALLIAVSAWLEASVPWVDRHPPVWSDHGGPIA